ncbi:helix-turn-helix domain-containing protein [Streptomyces sp. NPDC059679]|uniref:helix-turn-helix domain-containing protein n=1 Tax=Streptomyces sp. NPDC059679 TaxID=3346903 RepID=UPI0036CA1154
MGLRSSPTYRQRRLGAELRRMREQSGLSSYEMAARLGMKQPQLSHIEAGRTTIGVERLRVLAAESGVTDSTFIEALIEMEQSSGKGWWSGFRKRLQQPYLDLAESEAAAVCLRNYEPMFIPGLLQTREYATAVHRDGYARLSAEEQEAAVEFRMDRQKILTGEHAPRFHAIIHEAALRPSMGDHELMRAQLLRLVEASRLPNVTVQILPFDGPIAFGTGFLMIEPLVAGLSMTLVSHVEQMLYLEDAASIARYDEHFARLEAMALAPIDATAAPENRIAKDSLGLIQRILYPLL